MAMSLRALRAPTVQRDHYRNAGVDAHRSAPCVSGPLWGGAPHRDGRPLSSFGGRRPTHSGLMFWLMWKALSGSYFALTAASR